MGTNATTSTFDFSVHVLIDHVFFAYMYKNLFDIVLHATPMYDTMPSILQGDGMVHCYVPYAFRCNPNVHYRRRLCNSLLCGSRSCDIMIHHKLPSQTCYIARHRAFPQGESQSKGDRT